MSLRERVKVCFILIPVALVGFCLNANACLVSTITFKPSLKSMFIFFWDIYTFSVFFFIKERILFFPNKY